MQVKLIITAFIVLKCWLQFIAGHMRSCDVWRNATEAEFDNALEGMEKLVMNRLYELSVCSQNAPLHVLTNCLFNKSTFTPQVARTTPPRPFNPDDLERDRVLAQRIYLFGWVEEMHLDVPVGEGSEGFVHFAEQGILRDFLYLGEQLTTFMERYRAAQDEPL